MKDEEIKQSRLTPTLIAKGVKTTPAKVMILREWFANGFNAKEAIKTVTGEQMSDKQATSELQLIRLNHANVVAELQRNQRERTGATQEQLVNKLIDFMQSDATDFIGLSQDEIKALPGRKRSAIQRMTVRQRTTKVAGQDVIEMNTDIIFVDKLNALKELAKHIGFYGGNDGKRTTINIDKLSIENLQALIQASEGQ